MGFQIAGNVKKSVNKVNRCRFCKDNVNFMQRNCNGRGEAGMPDSKASTPYIIINKMSYIDRDLIFKRNVLQARGRRRVQILKGAEKADG